MEMGVRVKLYILSRIETCIKLYQLKKNTATQEAVLTISVPTKFIVCPPFCMCHGCHFIPRGVITIFAKFQSVLQASFIPLCNSQSTAMEKKIINNQGYFKYYYADNSFLLFRLYIYILLNGITVT